MQLQQVLFNLVVNEKDAMSVVEASRREPDPKNPVNHQPWFIFPAAVLLRVTFLQTNRHVG